MTREVPTGRRPGRTGMTILELLIGTALLSLIAILFTRIWITSRRHEATLGHHARIQHEARRGFIRLMQEIQESMGVVLPRDGSTKPYLILRDRTDRMAFFYQVRDDEASAREGRDIFVLEKRFARYGGTGEEAPVALIRDIGRLTFTASGTGGVVVNLQVRSGGRDYTILTLIRLKALYSLEAL